MRSRQILLGNFISTTQKSLVNAFVGWVGLVEAERAAQAEVINAIHAGTWGSARDDELEEPEAVGPGAALGHPSAAEQAEEEAALRSTGERTRRASLAEVGEEITFRTPPIAAFKAAGAPPAEAADAGVASASAALAGALLSSPCSPRTLELLAGINYRHRYR
jgi:hypothetical protein